LFKTFLKLADSCDACDLDYSNADSGDGPAVFMIFIGGFVSTIVLFVVRFSMDLPAGIALLLSIMSLLIVVGLLMQPLKGLMIALQFANKASEARLEKDNHEWT
jgi:uncharacterized protein (DUF983 family)